ncbi:hypothetical protein FKM82_031392 [Ascaphus truei]
MCINTIHTMISNWLSCRLIRSHVVGWRRFGSGFTKWLSVQQKRTKDAKFCGEDHVTRQSLDTIGALLERGQGSKRGVTQPVSEEEGDVTL